MALACGEEIGGEGAGGLGSGAFGDSRKAWILESSSEQEAGAKGESSVKEGDSAVQSNSGLGQDPRAHLPPNHPSCQVLVETQKQGYRPFSPFKTTDI